MEESGGGYTGVEWKEKVLLKRADGLQDEFTLHRAQTQFPADHDFVEGPPTWFLEYAATTAIETGIKDGIDDRVRDESKDGIKNDSRDGVKNEGKDGVKNENKDGIKNEEKEGTNNENKDGIKEDSRIYELSGEDEPTLSIFGLELRLSSPQHAQFNPHCNVLACAHRDRLLLHRVHSGHVEQIAEHAELPGTVTCLAWSPDGSCLAVAMEGAGLWWLNAFGQREFVLGQEQLGVYGLAALLWTRGHLVMLSSATGAGAGEMARSSLLLLPYACSSGDHHHPTFFTPDTIYLASLDHQITWQAIRQEGLRGVCVTRLGNRLAWIAGEGKLSIWTAARGEGRPTISQTAIKADRVAWLEGEGNGNGEGETLAVQRGAEICVIKRDGLAVMAREELPESELDYLGGCFDGSLAFVTRHGQLLGVRRAGDWQPLLWCSLRPPNTSLPHHHWQIDTLPLGQDRRLVFILRGAQLSCLELPALTVHPLLEEGVHWFRLLGGQGSRVWLLLRLTSGLELRRYPFDQPGVSLHCDCTHLVYPHSPTMGMLLSIGAQECKGLGEGLFTLGANRLDPLAPHLLRQDPDLPIEQLDGLVFEYLLAENALSPQRLCEWADRHPNLLQPAMIRAARKMEPSEAQTLISLRPNLFAWCLENDLEAACQLWVLLAEADNLEALLNALLGAQKLERLLELRELAERVYPEQISHWNQKHCASLGHSGRFLTQWRLFGRISECNLPLEQRLAALILDWGEIPNVNDEQLEAGQVEEAVKQMLPHLSNEDAALWRRLVLHGKGEEMPTISALLRKHGPLKPFV